MTRTAKAAAVLSLAALASAFHAPSTSTQHAIPYASSRAASSPLSMSSTQTEVERLRAAAAKAREEYEKLSKEAGKEVAPSGLVVDKSMAGPAAKNLSVEEARAISANVNFDGGDAATQTDALDKLVESGDFSLWKSAVRRPGSNMSKLVPFPVTLGSLETRTDGKVTGPSLGIGGEGDVKFEDFQDLTVAVVLGSTGLGIAALALLPENVGATFTYFFALIPIGFIGIGSVSPGIIAGAISSVRSEKDTVDATERICRHEVRTYRRCIIPAVHVQRKFMHRRCLTNIFCMNRSFSPHIVKIPTFDARLGTSSVATFVDFL